MNLVSESWGEKIFRIGNVIFLGVMSIIMLVPLLKVLATSLSSPYAVDTAQVILWPVEFTLASWENLIMRKDFLMSFGLNVFVTVVGTLLSLFITALMAYPLANKEFRIAKIIMLMVIITMVFRYPIIPYFLVVKELGLYDNVWALIIPQLIVAYNLIIMRTFFKQIPHELEEAAQLEGAGHFRMLFKIILPLSNAVLATLGIFYAVSYWNQFMHPLMFIDSQHLYPLQLRLRDFITNNGEIAARDLTGARPEYNAATLKAAAIIYSTVPILLVYPFLQRHFVKGAMLGSVK